MYDIQAIIQFAENDSSECLDAPQSTSYLHQTLDIFNVCGGCGNYTCTCKYHERKRLREIPRGIQKNSPAFKHAT